MPIKNTVMYFPASIWKNRMHEAFGGIRRNMTDQTTQMYKSDARTRGAAALTAIIYLGCTGDSVQLCKQAEVVMLR